MGLSSDGKLLAAGGSEDATIKIFNVATGQLVKSIDTGAGAVYTIDFDATNRVAFASLQDGSFRAFDIETGNVTTIADNLGWGWHLWDVSRDGRFIAGPGKGGIVIWDQKTYRELRTLPGNEGGTVFTVFSPDGRALASTGKDGVVRLWDVKTGKPISTLTGSLGPGTRLRFSPDGRRLAVWGQDGQIHLFGPNPAGKPAPANPPQEKPPVNEDKELLLPEDDP